MKELIPITSQPINETETLTCDGRALHEFLESKQHYADWMKGRIEKYGFAEGIDFICHKKMTNDNICLSISHTLTIDMAKQLSMVENNERGAEVRRYFIECERIAKEAMGGYKSKPRRADIELNARSAATSYRMMARMKAVYPPEMLAVFAAKSVHVLTGEPLQCLLPPVKDNRESWLSPTVLAADLNISAQVVGRTLKKLGLHGDNDPNHEWSQPIWNKSQHSDREVTSFLYKPDVVIPALEKALHSGGSQLN